MAMPLNKQHFSLTIVIDLDQRQGLILGFKCRFKKRQIQGKVHYLQQQTPNRRSIRRNVKRAICKL